jgi:gliding motility-associated-like protein
MRFRILIATMFLLIAPSIAMSQTLLYGEDFLSGNSNMTLNTAGVGTPAGNNVWVINNAYTGNTTYPNTTAQTSTVAGTIGTPGGHYLHINDTSSAVNNSNFSTNSASDRFAVTGNICTIGFTGVTFSFFYLVEGDANNYGEVYYQVNGGAWTQLGGTFNNQTLWRYQTFTNAAFDNVNSLRFGFRWKNGTSGTQNLSFSIDDILVTGTLNVTPSITLSSFPSQVCQNSFLRFNYQINPSLCAGDYSIELLGTSLTWQVNNLTQTTGSFTLLIPTTAPLGCYRLRMSRVSGSNPPKPPFFNGTATTACITIVACPNTITTLQPAVTIGSTPGAGDSVCVGSVIDIPFYSTGTFQASNVYTAWLSDSAGNFGTAGSQTLGSVPDPSTYDPSIPPGLPGSVSGLIPNTPEGCNYYIRVVSSNPNTVGISWGPFCIKNCDIRTNNRVDIAFCISTLTGDNGTVAVDINTPPKNVTYNPGNVFQLEVLDMQFFQRQYMGTALGSLTSTSSGTINVTIPALGALQALGLDAGAYYLRVVSTNTALKGSLIRMTIGAPYVANPLQIFSTDTVTCFGGAVFFNVNGFRPPQYNNKSSYQWFLSQNGGPLNPFPPPGLNPQPSLGIRFNSTGVFTVAVQETNFGCPGPLSPTVSVSVATVPNTSLGGSAIQVCKGDTVRYTVPFLPVTQYNWFLEAGGTIVDTANNEIKVAWDSIGVFKVKLSATNICGNDIDSALIQVHAPPIVDAGDDINLCEGDTAFLDGSTVGTNSVFWSPSGNLTNPSIFNPEARGLTDTTQFILRGIKNLIGIFQCTAYDTVMVNVSPVPDAFAGNDLLICNYESVKLDGGIGNDLDYTWYNTNGSLNDTTIRQPIASPRQSVEYTMRVTDPASGCFDEDNIILVVSQLVQEEPKYYEVCEGEEVTLVNRNTFYDFTWSTGSTDESITVDEPGTYTVTLSDFVGCVINNEYIVSISEPEFEPTAFDTLQICLGLSDSLIGRMGAKKYKWNTGEESRYIEVSNEGEYYLQLFDRNNCWAVDTYFVKILDDCVQQFFVPNTFTPNKDGLNENFYPRTLNVDAYEFWIFDRWGEVLFNSNGTEGWDGKGPSGTDYPIGVYTWKIQFKDLENQTQIRVGTFNLLR